MGRLFYVKMERMKMTRENKIILSLGLTALIFVLGVFVFSGRGKKSQLVIQTVPDASGNGAPSLNNKEENNPPAKNTASVPESEPAAAPTVPAPAAADPAQKAPAAETAAASSDTSGAPKIINDLVGWGFTKTNGRTIDTIIIHSSYNATGGDPHSVEDIINNEYKPNGVSPHYIIGRDGTIYRLVPDQDIAYHAGVSQMPDGRTNVNNFSIGIEIVETMAESPGAAQYASLNNLLGYLHAKYPIKHILGHSDIAPGRKTDPWNFDWSKIKLGKMK
jgi:hypothetical protein